MARKDESYSLRKDYIKRWVQARKAKNIAAGLCINCHKRPSIMTQRCDECQERRSGTDREYNRIRYLAYKNSKLCARCGCPLDSDGDDGTSFCINCRKGCFRIRWDR